MEVEEEVWKKEEVEEMLDVGYFGRERRIDGNGKRESKRVCGTKRKRKRKR